MRERLRTLVGEVFDVPSADVPEDASPETMSDWDSLRHLELMLALEMEFGVQLATETIPELTSLDAIEEFLRDQDAPAG